MQRRIQKAWLRAGSTGEAVWGRRYAPSLEMNEFFALNGALVNSEQYFFENLGIQFALASPHSKSWDTSPMIYVRVSLHQLSSELASGFISSASSALPNKSSSFTFASFRMCTLSQYSHHSYNPSLTHFITLGCSACHPPHTASTSAWILCGFHTFIGFLSHQFPSQHCFIKLATSERKVNVSAIMCFSSHTPHDNVCYKHVSLQLRSFAISSCSSIHTHDKSS